MANDQPILRKFPGNILVAVSLMILASSCGTIVKGYPKNKPFVYQTNINLKGDFTNEEKENLVSRLKGQLDDSMRSRSVSKVLWSVMKNPPVYDSVNADKSVVYMKALLGSLGYFRDSITYDTVVKVTKSDQHRTTVNFNVTPGKVVRFDSIAYNIKQAELQSLAMATLKESVLKKGEPFAKASVSVELDRLVDLYRNNGYLRFSREELIGLWDTLDISLLRPTLDPFEQLEILEKLKQRRENPTANLEMRLRPGFDTGKLVKYYVGNVYVYPDIVYDSASYTRTETLVSDSVRVISYKNMFKPRIFPPNIYFKRGEVYDQRKYVRTINRLNSLGAWRLVNIEQKPRYGQDTADFEIRLTPASKYSFFANLEGSRNQSAISGNLFGIALNLGLQNRNFARAANQANTNIRFGIELSDSSFVQTRQFVVSHNIYFPRVIPNLRFIKGTARETFRTILSFNAANTERKDLYNLTTINGSFGGEFQLGKRNITMQVRVPNIEFSHLNPRPQLDTLFKYNPSLRNIFTDGFISSISANMAITGGKSKRLNIFRANFEISGLLAGLIRNKFFDTNLYRYVKLDAEFAHKINIRRSAIALRLFAGVGYELESTVNPLKRNNLPFFKQYFAGGPNSMRAWALRKLGPGSLVRDFNGQNGLFERYGDVQIEANAEYRFPLATIAGVKVNGAVFTDIGNVWLLKSAAGPPEAVFSFSKMFKDLGIGAGVGLRVDFNFFVIRFDYSYKVKDPSPRPEDISLQNKWFGYKFPKGTQFQLGISYPFIL